MKYLNELSDSFIVNNQNYILIINNNKNNLFYSVTIATADQRDDKTKFWDDVATYDKINRCLYTNYDLMIRSGYLKYRNNIKDIENNINIVNDIYQDYLNVTMIRDIIQ